MKLGEGFTASHVPAGGGGRELEGLKEGCDDLVARWGKNCQPSSLLLFITKMVLKKCEVPAILEYIRYIYIYI